MTRRIVFITRHEVEIGPWSSWREAVEAWQRDIRDAGPHGWGWHGHFEEHTP